MRFCPVAYNVTAEAHSYVSWSLHKPIGIDMCDLMLKLLLVVSKELYVM